MKGIYVMMRVKHFLAAWLKCSFVITQMQRRSPWRRLLSYMCAHNQPPSNSQASRWCWENVSLLYACTQASILQAFKWWTDESSYLGVIFYMLVRVHLQMVLSPTLHFTWLNEPLANRRLFFFSLLLVSVLEKPISLWDPYRNHNLPADT